MKKALLYIACICIITAACNKNNNITSTTPQPQTTSNTNELGKTWKVDMYDSLAFNSITSPGEADFMATSTSSTGGTGVFHTRFNGSTPDSEIVTYVLSNNGQNVVFTNTGGNTTRLSGGGTWTIHYISGDSVRMSCSTNKCLKLR